MEKRDSIFLAGHRGLAGSAILRRLRSLDYSNLLLKSRAELDLTRQAEVEQFFSANRPEYVILAAARVGGIFANTQQGGDFIRDNLLIQTNVIDAARHFGARKLLFLGSSCIYPRMAPQPIPETSLLAGPLEPSNEPYAVAKIAGIRMCQAYREQYGFDAISIMPANLYGPNDRFDLTTSHVLPALLRKFHEAKSTRAESVTLWGTGNPRREFLHVDDLAEACLFVMDHYSGLEILNVGVDDDISIRDLAAIIGEIVGYSGRREQDLSKPDGTPRKLLDSSRLRSLGWRPRIPLREGIRSTYQWYVTQSDPKPIGAETRGCV